MPFTRKYIIPSRKAVRTMSNQQPRAMKGPRGMRGRGGPKARNPRKTLKRVLGIVMKEYSIQCVIVLDRKSVV